MPSSSSSSSSAADHARRFFRLTPRSRLALDLLLVVLVFALDARDAWFKLRWLGPRDANAFVAVTRHEAQPAPLEPTRNLAFGGQKYQRASGWSSFLQKCETLHPLTDAITDGLRDGDAPSFSHALGRNCEIGLPENSRHAPELMMSSSVRVDSVTWAACQLLQPHRKPAICRSAVVRLFTERYNMVAAPSLLQYKHHNNVSASFMDISEADDYSAVPGSDAEAELTDLLSVISTSSPLSAVVCVEAFVPRGPGRYTASIFGCGNPSYYKSAFVGVYATAFPLFHQDKARLARDTLHVLGMTFVTRENSRSLFLLRSGANGLFELRHKSVLNFSSFGALYTIMIALDMLLLTLNTCSAVEIGRLVLGQSHQQGFSAGNSGGGGAYSLRSHNYKLGVLSAGLHRSKLVMALMLVARLISWMMILPSVSIWNATELQTGKTHAWLTAARGWVLVLMAVNSLWDACVALGESRALAFVRTTHVRVSEVAVIAALVAYAKRDEVFAITATKRQLEMQMLSDARSFRGHVALANTFSGQLDFLQNTPSHVLRLVFAPLGEIITWGIVGVAVLALVRSWYYRAVHRDLLSDHESSLGPTKLKKMQKRGSKASVLPDVSESSPAEPILGGENARGAQFAFSSSSLLPSQTRAGGTGLALSLRDLDTGEGDEPRLPLEQLLRVPVRARSLVRSVWFMEKRAGQHVALHPTLPLEHGVVLDGGNGGMWTRCGFFDVLARRAVELVVSVGLGTELVALLLGLSPAALHKHVQRARKRGDAPQPLAPDNQQRVMVIRDLMRLLRPPARVLWFGSSLDESKDLFEEFLTMLSETVRSLDVFVYCWTSEPLANLAIQLAHRTVSPVRVRVLVCRTQAGCRGS